MTYTDSEILRIVKEDVLRISGETGGRINLDSIALEVKASDRFVREAIKGLEEGGLIRSERNLAELTQKGWHEARRVVEKHVALEEFFGETRSKGEAHGMAHILEHHASGEAINNIKKLATFKGHGIPLMELEPGGEGMITDITLAQDELFERVVSMGICPGEKIRLINDVSGKAILEVKNKKFALDKKAAQKIKVLEHGEP